MLNINIILTNKCNLSCKYCFYTEGYKCFEKKEFLNQNKLLSFIKKINNYDSINSIMITGGEPMLIKNITSIIKDLINYSTEIILLTNGTLINDEHIEFFINNNIYLQISLDSYKNKYHDSIRGNHKRTLETLEKFSNLGYKNIDINFTASPLNYKLISEVKNFAQLNNFGLNIGVIDSKNSRFNWNLVSTEIKNDFLNLYIKNNKLDYKNKLLKYILFRKVEKEINCPSLNRFFTIDINGNLTRCYNNIIIGNIYYDDINKIIENINNKEQYKCYIRNNCFTNI